ncbi:FAD-dependent oxidoreductase [Salipiger abyssi]|uniref:FAD-dependent oxidoreductase n=1 Tax=Salipiger abyssi TaxID=1250539 RepID=UPI001A8CBEB6|nr:FAD-dependent oxidoreductase [Salipiger abyssi]MBN9887920.1 FAD-dependent oxidoreductase [Salipiger abyssi]
MPELSRRRFTRSLLAASALSAAIPLTARGAGRNVIVGGGPAGATAALALRRARPKDDILLIERDPSRLAGGPAARFAQPGAPVDLATLRQAGIAVALDEVTEVDWRAARLSLFSGRLMAFDRLLLAPGTTPVAEALDGLGPVARHLWPAAWGSAREARRLAAQLSALPTSGHLVLRLPGTGLSHPDIALARALELDRWLRRNRPGARMTVLDGAPDAPLAARFRARGGHAAWHTADDGGTVLRLDAPRGVIDTSAGRLYADVVNFLTPRQAGQIAQIAGLTDESGWCPCDGAGRSLIRRSAAILGDARRDAPRSIASALASGANALV